MTKSEQEAWGALDGKVLTSGHTLRVSWYRNGRVSLEAITPDGSEVECRVTVNLVDNTLEEFEFHVRFEDRMYAGAVFDALRSSGLALPTGKVVSAGFVERYAEVWKLNRKRKPSGHASVRGKRNAR